MAAAGTTRPGRCHAVPTAARTDASQPRPSWRPTSISTSPARPHSRTATVAVTATAIGPPGTTPRDSARTSITSSAIPAAVTTVAPAPGTTPFQNLDPVV